jgi:hypothetical protein
LRREFTGVDVLLAGQTERLQRVLRDALDRFAARLDAQVELLHRRRVERVSKERQHAADLGMARQRRTTHERCGGIRREEVAVVVEHDEIVDREPPVGRIDVETVDVAGARRLRIAAPAASAARRGKCRP